MTIPRLEKKEKIMGSYIRTHTWRKMDPFNPDPSQIVIEDIAQALSNICRFAGHTTVFYSVAEHSCLVSDLLPRDDALAGLLHDASVVYLIDVPRPIKRAPQMAPYREAEDNLLRIIAGIYGFEFPLSESVKDADNCLLHTEQPQLFRGMVDMGTTPGKAIEGLVLNLWTPEEAKSQFMERFRILA